MKKVLLILCILTLSFSAKSQIDIDSIYKQRACEINKQVEALAEITTKSNSFFNKEFYEIIGGFSVLRAYYKEDSEVVFQSILESEIIPVNQKQYFFIYNHMSFYDDEIQIIRTFLDRTIHPSNQKYHELVSLFSLTSQKELLEKDLSDSLFIKLKQNLSTRVFGKDNEEQLKNLATLSNLGFYNEDIYIDEINELYSFAKKINKIDLFQRKIMINSISLLNSKKSIIKTLYMLDEQDTHPHLPLDEITFNNYANNYYQSCIVPKVTGADLTLVDWHHENTDKDYIIQTILNNDERWKKHIKKR